MAQNWGHWNHRCWNYLRNQRPQCLVCQDYLNWSHQGRSSRGWNQRNQSHHHLKRFSVQWNVTTARCTRGSKIKQSLEDGCGKGQCSGICLEEAEIEAQHLGVVTAAWVRTNGTEWTEKDFVTGAIDAMEDVLAAGRETSIACSHKWVVLSALTLGVNFWQMPQAKTLSKTNQIVLVTESFLACIGHTSWNWA